MNHLPGTPGKLARKCNGKVRRVSLVGAEVVRIAGDGAVVHLVPTHLCHGGDMWYNLPSRASL